LLPTRGPRRTRRSAVRAIPAPEIGPSVGAVRLGAGPRFGPLSAIERSAGLIEPFVGRIECLARPFEGSRRAIGLVVSPLVGEPMVVMWPAATGPSGRRPEWSPLSARARIETATRIVSGRRPTVSPFRAAWLRTPVASLALVATAGEAAAIWP
jgi:hypothetical protein